MISRSIYRVHPDTTLSFPDSQSSHAHQSSHPRQRNRTSPEGFKHPFAQARRLNRCGAGRISTKSSQESRVRGRKPKTTACCSRSSPPPELKVQIFALISVVGAPGGPVNLDPLLCQLSPARAPTPFLTFPSSPAAVRPKDAGRGRARRGNITEPKAGPSKGDRPPSIAGTAPRGEAAREDIAHPPGGA